MQAYGTLREDRGCCPGHDKFPTETYNNKPRTRRKHKINNRIAKRRARRWGRDEIQDQLDAA